MSAFLFLAGCGQQAVLESFKVCSCDDAFEFPQSSYQQQSFTVNADCRIEIPDEKIKETYNLKFYYEPMSNVYMQADHVLLGKAVIAGGNDDQYWLWIRHKEVDSYWFGSWQSGCIDSSTSLPINPSVILEAMGLLYCPQGYKKVECSCSAHVFSVALADGGEKKLWFDCCDDKLAKIEIFGAKGNPVVLCTIKNYFSTSDGAKLPAKLEMTVYSDSREIAKATIKFKPESFKLREYSDVFRKSFFAQPKPDGVKNVYQILDDGKVVKINGD
jgi:hypothetical protein